MKELIIFVFVVVLGWLILYTPPKADWANQLAPRDPQQSTNDLPAPWAFKDFTIIPRAHYSIQAVVMSKHSYWGPGPQDSLSYYDLALGWGPMSESAVIKRLHISQGDRWYNYSWSGSPPLNPDEIISHSANVHIVPDNPGVFQAIQDIKQYDLVNLEGYLIDINSRTQDWHWRSSLSRTDIGDGACELFWVTKVERQ